MRATSFPVAPEHLITLTTQYIKSAPPCARLTLNSMFTTYGIGSSLLIHREAKSSKWLQVAERCRMLLFEHSVRAKNMRKSATYESIKDYDNVERDFKARRLDPPGFIYEFQGCDDDDSGKQNSDNGQLAMESC